MRQDHAGIKPYLLCFSSRERAGNTGEVSAHLTGS
jgi:hypothetical protein